MKTEQKRRFDKMKAWTKRNWQNIFVVVFAISCVTVTALFYSEPTSTDWLAQKQPVSNKIMISNGNAQVIVNKDSMLAFDPIWNNNGSLECWYVVFEYKGSRFTLELVDNDIATATEWKESIEACFPVGGSNDI
ncbi:MAG: hypothetical protein GY928_21465 [Colwellia sp.]|nr:hypothetical protein [Colwellia sp.]